MALDPCCLEDVTQLLGYIFLTFPYLAKWLQCLEQQVTQLVGVQDVKNTLLYGGESERRAPGLPSGIWAAICILVYISIPHTPFLILPLLLDVHRGVYHHFHSIHPVSELLLRETELLTIMVTHLGHQDVCLFFNEIPLPLQGYWVHLVNVIPWWHEIEVEEGKALWGAAIFVFFSVIASWCVWLLSEVGSFPCSLHL